MIYSERDREEEINIGLMLLYNILHTYFIYLFNINDSIFSNIKVDFQVK